VSVGSTLNAHFGPIDTGEMGKLLPRKFERKLCSANHFFDDFYLFTGILELHEWISAQEML